MCGGSAHAADLFVRLVRCRTRTSRASAAATVMTRTVIVIGPSPDAVGGMASVVAQILRLEFDGRYRLRFFPTTVSTGDHETSWQRLTRHVRHLGRLRRLIRESDRSIVHIHTCSGFSVLRSAVDMMIARSHGCRTVLHSHGAKFDSFYEALPAYRRLLLRRCLSRADRVIALSNGWRRRLHDMAPKARLCVIENAIECPAPTTVSRRPGPFRFVLLARMDEWKGIDDLLSACATLAADSVEFELVLAGPGGTAGDAVSLEAKIEGMGLAGIVRYVGSVHGREKDDLLTNSDAYVLASWSEGLPISLLEAIAYGLPVVATRVGAVPEVITEGREGLLVPAKQPDDLARAMRTMIDDPSCRATMSDAARRLAKQRFSVVRLRNDLLRLYDEVGCTDALTPTSPLSPEEFPAGGRECAAVR